MKRVVRASSDSWVNKYADVVHKYVPSYGQGETIASQAATCVNKIVYKWYNDGDVYDNNWYGGLYEEGANDLSSYANWLYKYMSSSVANILSDVHMCQTDEDYDNLLRDLADYVLDDEYLESLEEEPAKGDIYNCDGPFEFNDSYWDDEEAW